MISQQGEEKSELEKYTHDPREDKKGKTVK